MVKKNTFTYIGKERIFTNNSAFQNNKNLEKMTTKLQKITTNPEGKFEDIYLTMGEYVSTIFEDFEPKEMLEADELDIYLVRGLNTLKNLIKMGKTNKEIEKAKNELIEKSINEELFRL